METWQAINTVRVVRKFSDEPIADEQLDRILNAGRRTGSSKNDQHWAFIVCRDREHLRELAAVGHYADPTKLTAANRAGGRVALSDLVHEERW
jgi:nitroreductase